MSFPSRFRGGSEEPTLTDVGDVRACQSRPSSRSRTDTPRGEIDGAKLGVISYGGQDLARPGTARRCAIESLEPLSNNGEIFVREVALFPEDEA